MKIVHIFLVLSLMVTSSFAGGKELVAKLGLNPSSKAIKQWQRVFKKERKMKKYGINTLSDADKQALETYLEDHAADSDHPEAAGI